MDCKFLLLSIVFVLLMVTQPITSCFNRGGSSTSSSSSTFGSFGNGGLTGQSVSSNVQCINGVCTHQEQHQTFG